MTRPRHRPPFPPGPPTRLFAAAWIVLAIALLGAAVLPLSAPATPAFSLDAEAEAAEEGLEDEEWELEVEGEETEEEFEAGGTEGSTVLPADCILRTADPNVVAVPAHDRLQLTLRYTSEAPTKVGVEYWLKGGKGSLQLGSVKRHLGKRGALRMSRHLDERELTKVQAARLIMLRLDVPSVDSYCKPFLVFRLAAKHRQGSRTIWSEP